MWAVAFRRLDIIGGVLSSFILMFAVGCERGHSHRKPIVRVESAHLPGRSLPQLFWHLLDIVACCPSSQFIWHLLEGPGAQRPL